MCKEIYKENVHATCPHCSKDINMIFVCKVESVIGTRYIYFCSECQKKLGMSSQKDFQAGIINPALAMNNGTINRLI